jgi:hypothetical protein
MGPSFLDQGGLDQGGLDQGGLDQGGLDQGGLDQGGLNHAASTRPNDYGRVDCVVLSCFDHETQFFASMLGPAGIRLHRACTLEMADFLLIATHGTVLISDTVFLDGSWRDALSMTAAFHPTLAALICSDPGDRETIAGAEELGALDVLWRPVGIDRLRASIWMAHEVTLERSGWIEERTAQAGGAENRRTTTEPLRPPPSHRER